jgi:formylglycine-generating enzyme required for sulfatase activity
LWLSFQRVGLTKIEGIGRLHSLQYVKTRTMSTVFISYRRENAAGEARALFNDLAERLGEDSVFMDVDSIALGRDFRSALQKTTASCDLMLVLIGRNWADARDEEGRVRLENPADYVRIEVEAGLKRDIVVTPVLVQGAHMPAPEDLPAEIRNLAYRNAFELSHSRWESDVQEMVRRLELGGGADSRPVKPNALRQSVRSQEDVTAGAAAIPQAEPQHGLLGRRVRLTRRQAWGVAALAAVGAGAAIATPSIRRMLSKPSMRTSSFDTATVDQKGVRNPPERYSAVVFTEALGPVGGMDMVSIPGGSFTMGSPADEPERQLNEGPQHHVALAPFFIGAWPVTQAQWSAVVMAHPGKIHRDLDPSPSFFKGIDLPVESITWNQADEFCLRLAEITGRAYRLPSEAEWEFACRAGTVTPFNCGPTITPDLANYCGTGGAVCGDSGGKSIASDVYNDVKYQSGAYGQGPVGVFRATTTRPGTFPPNRFGLYDTHGNVWEYCLDKWSDSYADTPRDGSAYVSGPSDSARLLRGGSWSHNPAICRSAYRDSLDPSSSGWLGRIGLRVACTL